MNQGFSYLTHVQKGGNSVLNELTTRFTHSTREQWKERLQKGEIELNGMVAQGHEILKSGQFIIWHRPPWQEENVPLQFTVLYTDQDLLAVAKPSGLPTMPAGGFLEHTLLMQVRKNWPNASPLHRLGRGTSGLVLFALNTKTNQTLSKDWREHRIEKKYRALASGICSQNHLEIHTPIGLVPHTRLGQIYAANPAGKPACSIAQVIERHPDSTLFEIQIKTGRPHQIRIHLASIGFPLLGDPLYKPGGLPTHALPSDLGYWLHAHSLRFFHPTQKNWTTIIATPPDNLTTKREKMLDYSDQST